MELLVAVVAGLIAFTAGAVSTRQTRSLQLAEKRLERHDALMAAARTFERLAEPFNDSILRHQVSVGDEAKPPSPDYRAVSDTVDRVLLVAPLKERPA